MGEMLNASMLRKNKTNLSPKEVNWIKYFNIYELYIAMTKSPLEFWEIRLEQSQFENWMKERIFFKLFFDGALKGNLGMVGGGGVIIFPEGKIEIEYYLNIGNETNNMAEVYFLGQGLKQ